MLISYYTENIFRVALWHTVAVSDWTGWFDAEQAVMTRLHCPVLTLSSAGGLEGLTAHNYNQRTPVITLLSLPV